MRAGAFYGLLCTLPVLGAVYLGATGYLFFRDDMVSALMARHARQQYAYEDRLAAMRLQLDRVTSRQLLDQDSFEGKVQHLIAREAQLETRTAIVAALGERIGASNETTATIAPASAKAPARSAAAAQKRLPPAAGGPEPKANSFAPMPQPMDDLPFKPDRPRPDGFELRGAPLRSSALSTTPAQMLAEAADAEMSTHARIELLAASLDRIERRQVEALAALAAPAARKAEELAAVISETGLSVARLKAPGSAKSADKDKSAVGGPFVPATLDDAATPFERQLVKVQGAFAALDRIHRVLPYIPVRKPLNGPIEVTSNFGYRSDPFLGRPALHSGMDMRAETGAPARATANGKVVTASWSGGYGNLVEIDHGNGISTRYGHLSAISVEEGQTVKAGDTIGRVGSTGRSTGPHLHYEVRIDNEATDPARFVKAARLLASND
ncbi:MAG: M23 family metallopeptidase [Rhodoblastus sp.]